jgi:hypothetical protein
MTKQINKKNINQKFSRKAAQFSIQKQQNHILKIFSILETN